MKYERTVNIGDTDENADWIKTPENRKREREIHEKLAKKYRGATDGNGRRESKDEPPAIRAGG